MVSCFLGCVDTSQEFLEAGEHATLIVIVHIGEGIGDDTQKIHDSGASAAFVESFKQSDDKKSYTGKLKTTVQIGPNVTEQSIADRILGKRMGEVQAMLKSINGVTEVKTTPSYFWVTSVPEDINKVKIQICSSEDKCE